MSHRFPTMAGLRILVLATATTALKEAPTFSVPTVLSNDMILGGLTCRPSAFPEFEVVDLWGISRKHAHPPNDP